MISEKRKMRTLIDVLNDISNKVEEKIRTGKNPNNWSNFRRNFSRLLTEIEEYKRISFFFFRNLTDIILGNLYSNSNDVVITTYAFINLDEIKENERITRARVLIPLDYKIDQLFEIGNDKILEKVRKYLQTKNWRRHLLYSHHDETLPDTLEPNLVNRAIIIRQKVDKTKAIESIINELFEIYKSTKKGFSNKNEFEKLVLSSFGADNKEELYDIFETTLIYSVNLTDILNEIKRNKKDNKNTLFSRPSDNLIKKLEELISKYIPQPLAFLSFGIKGQSFPDKFLLDKYSSVLEEAYDKGYLSPYLLQKGITTERRPKSRDLSDFVRYRLIVFGAKIPRNIEDAATLRKNEEEIKAKKRLYKIIEGITGCKIGDAVREVDLKDISEEDLERYNVYVSEEEYKNLESKGITGKKYFIQEKGFLMPGVYYAVDAATAKDYLEGKRVIALKPNCQNNCIIVNFSDPECFQDYIKNPKNSGYEAIHARVEALPKNYDIPLVFELQAKTNLMDTLQELDQRQNHDDYKKWQLALIDFLIDYGFLGITKRRTSLEQDMPEEDLQIAREEGRSYVYAIRKLLSPGYNYVGMQFGT